MGRIRANCKGIFSWNQWYICDHSTWEAEAGGPWVWGRPGCLSCFSITVIKHHDEGNLQKKLFNWTYFFRAVEFVVAKQSHGRKNHWELIFGLANRKQRGHTRNGRSHLKSQIPQTTDIPLNPSQSIPTIRTQVFKHMSLWEPFSFRPQYQAAEWEPVSKTKSRKVKTTCCVLFIYKIVVVNYFFSIVFSALSRVSDSCPMMKTFVSWTSGFRGSTFGILSWQPMLRILGASGTISWGLFVPAIIDTNVPVEEND